LRTEVCFTASQSNHVALPLQLDVCLAAVVQLLDPLDDQVFFRQTLEFEEDYGAHLVGRQVGYPVLLRIALPRSRGRENRRCSQDKCDGGHGFLQSSGWVPYGKLFYNEKHLLGPAYRRDAV